MTNDPAVPKKNAPGGSPAHPMRKGETSKPLSITVNRDVVDGIPMGTTRTCMWSPNLGDWGRYRVEWSKPAPPKPPRVRKWDPRPRVNCHDCDSMVEAVAYLAARTKYENDAAITIRIIDRAATT